MESLWQIEAIRSYVSGFELLTGGLILFQGHYVSDPVKTLAGLFKDPVLNGRFREVLERRCTLENIGAAPSYVFAITSLLLAAFTQFTAFWPLASYALCYVSAAFCFSWALLRIRNNGEHRAATLTPRTFQSVVPLWVFAAGIISVISSMTALTTQGVGITSLVITGTGVFLIACAWHVATRMPGMLEGEDMSMAAFVERLLRRLRVGFLLILTCVVTMYFLLITAEHSAHSTLELSAAAAAIAATATVVGWWYWIRYGSRFQEKSLVNK